VQFPAIYKRTDKGQLPPGKVVIKLNPLT